MSSTGSRVSSPFSSPASSSLNISSNTSNSGTATPTTTSTTEVALRSITTETSSTLQMRVQESTNRLVLLERMIYIAIALTAATLFVGGKTIVGSLVVAALVIYMIKSYLDDKKVQSVAQQALSQV